MSGLDRIQKQMLEHQLLDRLRALDTDAGQPQGPANVAIGDDAGRPGAEHPPASAIRELRHAQLSRRRSERHSIEDTLRQVGRDDFGICVDCGTGIPFAQLRLDPTTQRCAGCQYLHERALANGVSRGPHAGSTQPTRTNNGGDMSANTGDTSKSSGRGGISQKVQPDAMLSAIVGSEPITRADVTKRIWDYIKSNNLQDSADRRRINADDKLLAIFDGKAQVSMFEMTKLVNQHLK